MLIHFYSDRTFPHGMAAEKRRLCYAKGLLKCGDEVQVHCVNRVFNFNEDDGFGESGEYLGIKYNYISGKHKHKNKILRGLDWNIFDPIRAFFYSIHRIKKNDIVYVYLYPIFLQLLLIIAGKFKGAILIKETCEHPSALGNINSIWHKICKWYEYHFVMPLYDGFIPISRELETFVNIYKNKKAKSIIIPILVEENQFNIDFTNIKNPYTVPYIIHTGTMLEQKDSISKIIKAFARYKTEYKSNVRLVFTGPHANDKCKYIKLMEDLGVRDSIDLLGLVSVEEIAVLQHFASLTIIYKSDNLQTRNCFPTKLGEMLISGVPVITTTIGDANLYLENGVSAFIFKEDDEDDLVNKMRILLNDKDRSKIMGEEGRNVARQYFNPIYQGQRLHDFYSNLVAL